MYTPAPQVAVGVLLLAQQLEIEDLYSTVLQYIRRTMTDAHSALGYLHQALSVQPEGAGSGPLPRGLVFDPAAAAVARLLGEYDLSSPVLTLNPSLFFSSHTGHNEAGRR
eukprot:COSAG05_NODE_40_length_27088_cov_92.858276_9_plen_110_part_00